MKSIIVPFSVLFSLATALPALPAPQADPVRILPRNWSWDIISHHGPGCNDNTTSLFQTRPTYGWNTVDGSEIYFWHFAIPGMMASVGPGVDESSTWCEITASYTEHNNKDNTTAITSDYQLKMHKNGTEVQATYLPLEAGVTANWKFTYYPEHSDEIIDTINVNGPLNGSSYGDTFQSQPAKKLMQWDLPQCGSGKVRFRTDLTLKSNKDGAKGTVASELEKPQGEPAGYYGVQPGISYDWEEC